MPVKIMRAKPTSAGQRFMVRIKDTDLHKGKPCKSLLEIKTATSGRNNLGRITVRHRGGGHKRFLRKIDFKRDKENIPGTVERIEYDPNRSAHIALIVYKDGERRYIIAPRGLKAGQIILAGVTVPIKVGNSLPLRHIPVGTVIHCLEMKKGKGAQLARSAGAMVQLLAIEGDYATVRLRSGEMRKIHADCKATIGEVGNSEHNLRCIGKAGIKRHMGIRPTVRGVAMNPVDHPMGGGEGRTSGGRHPCTPKGTPTKGYRTRNNKRTDWAIISRRKK